MKIPTDFEQDLNDDWVRPVVKKKCPKCLGDRIDPADEDGDCYCCDCEENSEEWECELMGQDEEDEETAKGY